MAIEIRGKLHKRSYWQGRGRQSREWEVEQDDTGDIFVCCFYGPDCIDVDSLTFGDVVVLELRPMGSKWSVKRFWSEKNGWSRKDIIGFRYGSYSKYQSEKKAVVRRVAYGPGFVHRLERQIEREGTVESGARLVAEIRAKHKRDGAVGLSSLTREELVTKIRRLLSAWEAQKKELEKWKAQAGWYEAELDKLRGQIGEVDEMEEAKKRIFRGKEPTLISEED